MKLIKKLIMSLITIIAIIAVAVIGGYVYVRVNYGIDLFNTVSQLKVLSEKVDESKLCPEAFDKVNDMKDVQGMVNSSVENMIEYSKDNYVVNLENLPENMKAIIKLSDKQVGALANQISYQQTGGVISVGNKSIDYELKQIDFSDITTNGSTDFNIVVRLDLAMVKDEMKGFPLKFLKKYVPDYFYVSSTVKVDKVEDTPFAYELEHKSLTINNLDKEGTDDLFNTLDKIFKFGNAESLNLKVGETVVGALIGNEKNPGFAYALKSKGASDFKFVEESGVDYFIVNI